MAEALDEAKPASETLLDTVDPFPLPEAHCIIAETHGDLVREDASSWRVTEGRTSERGTAIGIFQPLPANADASKTLRQIVGIVQQQRQFLGFA